MGAQGCMLRLLKRTCGAAQERQPHTTAVRSSYVGFAAQGCQETKGEKPGPKEKPGGSAPTVQVLPPRPNKELRLPGGWPVTQQHNGRPNPQDACQQPSLCWNSWPKAFHPQQPLKNLATGATEAIGACLFFVFFKKRTSSGRKMFGSWECRWRERHISATAVSNVKCWCPGLDSWPGRKC